jgi:peptidoglycan biosynthesis protein MviN/MurJ (putative lipid II flippase)
LVLRLPIVRLVYGTGAFDWQDTILTSWSLALLTGSIIGQTIELILLRAFYALKNTWKPLISIFLGVAINLLGAYYLTNFFSHYYDWRPIVEQIWVQISQANGEGVMPVIHSFFKDTVTWMTTRGTSNYAVGGLALSLSLSYLFQVIISSLMLKVLTWKETVSPILKKIANTLIMITGMYFLFKLFDFRLDTSRTVYVIILFLVTSLGGGLLYLLGSKIFSPREYDMAVALIKRIWNRIKNLNKNGNRNNLKD